MNEDIIMLKEISDRLISGTSLDFKRYLFPKIDWRNRFVCLKGGKGKTFRQIKDTPNSFIAYDDVEMGVGNKIPLWLFGFLY